MADKRMLIIPANLLQKIDENRGDLSIAEFIEFLIDSRLEQKTADERYATQEALTEVEEDIKGLLRSVLDFVVSYGMELGPRRGNNDLASLTKKLDELGVAKESSRQLKKTPGK